jgi:hypothetical protein
MSQVSTPSKNVAIKREGYLLKKARFGKYRKYWFEVDEVSEEVLYYTDNPSLGPLKSKLVGNISLLNAEISTKSSKKHDKIIIKGKSGKRLASVPKYHILKSRFSFLSCIGQS